VTGDGPTNSDGNAESDGQRERLIDAFMRTAPELGYGNTTVTEVAAAAGVPGDAFYDHFSSKHQLLSAAYDTFVDRMFDEVGHASRAGEDWPVRVKQAVAAGLAFIAETATRARFFAVEAPAAGPLMFDRYIVAAARVAFALRGGRDRYPKAADLPDMTEQILVFGTACLVSSALLSEEPTRLASLESELVEILLTPYLGRDEARRIAG
jgi:AcrR family transcriptional regulator